MEEVILLVLVLAITSPFWAPALVAILLSIAAIVAAARGKNIDIS